MSGGFGEFAGRGWRHALRLAAGTALLAGGLLTLFLAQRAGPAAGTPFEAGTALGLAAASGSVMLLTYGWRNPEGLRSPVETLAGFVMLLLAATGVGIAYPVRATQPLFLVANGALAGLGLWALVDSLREARASLKTFLWVPLVAAWIAAAIGLTITLGWLAGSARIVQGIPGSPPMRLAAALCLLLSGLAFVATIRGRARVAGVLLGAPVAIATTRLVEIAAGMDLGLAHYLTMPGTMDTDVALGRMPAPTAIAFLAVAAALFAAFRARRNELAWPVVWGLGFAITAVGGLVLMDYGGDGIRMQPWGNTNPMAFWTSLGLTVLGTGVMGYGLVETDRRSTRGVRGALLVAVLGIVVSAVNWIALNNHQEAGRRAGLEGARDTVVHAVENFTRVRLSVFKNTSERLAAADPARREQDFRIAARMHVRDFPGITEVAFVDAHGIVRYLEARPGVESFEGTPFAIDAVRLLALERARASGEIVIEPFVKLRTGEFGALILVAVPPPARSAEIVVAAVSLPALFEAMLSATAQGYAVEIREGERLLYARDAGRGDEAYSRRMEADARIYGHVWHVTVWPTPATMRLTSSTAPLLALLLGLLGSVLLATALRFGAMARERARLAEARSAALAAEVAERARAEAALESARGELQGVFDSITDGFYVLDHEWRFVYVNPSAEAILRLPADQLLGHSVWELFPEARQAPVYEDFHRAVREQRTVSVGGYYAPLDLWYESRAYPHPKGLSVYLRDVSEQKRAHELLRRSEEMRARAQRIARLGSWEFDVASGKFSLSPEVHEIFGRDPAEFGGTIEHFFAYAHPEDAVALRAATARSVREGLPVDLEFRIVRPDGETRVMHVLGDDVAGTGQGRIFSGTVQDITARKRDELALRESEERYRNLVEGVDAIVWEADAQTLQFTFVSRRAEVMLGYPLAQWLTESTFWVDHLHPEDRGQAVSFCGAAVAQHKDHQFEYRALAADGREVWLRDIVRVPVEPDGSVRRLRGLMVDITELRRANLERDAAFVDLERSNRDLQDFAFVASHDLQEPLRKVQAFGGRLRDEYLGLLGERGADYLTRMTGAAVRMQGLIEDLLRYSRVTSRGQPFASVDLGRIAQEVLSDLETSIEAAQAAVELQNLPRIDADPTQMRQLFQNLMGNALKFRAVERPLRITVSATEIRHDGKEFYRIEFRDNGIGFDPQHAQNIFMPFHRLHGRGQFEGSGIGLAIVRKIVERHGGRVRAESQPGVGSAFVVELPVRHAGVPPLAIAATGSDATPDSGGVV